MTRHRWCWFWLGWLTGLFAALATAAGAYVWGYKSLWRTSR